MNLTLRKIPAPTRVKGFAWRLAHKKLQAKDNLLKRNIILGGSNSSCVFCNHHLESASHLLFECDFALEVGRRCYM
ncbi:hypothetical protein HKD37_14G039903 [Glycine soja]